MKKGLRHVSGPGQWKEKKNAYIIILKKISRKHSWGAANLKPSKTFSLGLKVVNMVCSFQNLIKTFTSLGLEIESNFLSLIIILETWEQQHLSMIPSFQTW